MGIGPAGAHDVTWAGQRGAIDASSSSMPDGSLPWTPGAHPTLEGGGSANLLPFERQHLASLAQSDAYDLVNDFSGRNVGTVANT